jgi:hypothetical protein
MYQCKCSQCLGDGSVIRGTVVAQEFTCDACDGTGIEWRASNELDASYEPDMALLCEAERARYAADLVAVAQAEGWLSDVLSDDVPSWLFVVAAEARL